MCTTISAKAPISGSGKGAEGWFALDHVYVGYDHPFAAPLEHALNLDFVSESVGLSARVAVELSRESARELALQILAALEQADAYEGDRAVSPPPAS